jgi:hypothetical protein
LQDERGKLYFIYSHLFRVKLIVKQDEITNVMNVSILTSISGIETYLRSEYREKSRERLIDLIEKASLDVELTKDLHTLRQYRNS